MAFLGVVAILPESLKPDIRERLAEQQNMPLLEQLRAVLSRRVLTMIVAMGFLFMTAWALLEAILGFWADAKFDYGPRHVGFLMVWMGVFGVIVQV